MELTQVMSWIGFVTGMLIYLQLFLIWKYKDRNTEVVYDHHS
jgi:hypothetical protein